MSQSLPPVQPTGSMPDGTPEEHGCGCSCLEQDLRVVQSQILSAIASQMRQSLDLNSILQRTLDALQQVLHPDRILIYQCGTDVSPGKVLIEVCRSSVLSLQDWQIDGVQADFCQSLGNSTQTGIQAIDNLDTIDLDLAYRQLLQAFQVKAQLALPLWEPSASCDLCSQNPTWINAQPLESSEGQTWGDQTTVCQKTWGFLILQQCDQPRHWQKQEVNLLEQTGDLLAVAIQQSIFCRKLRNTTQMLEAEVNERTRQLNVAIDTAGVLQRITDKVHQTLDEGEIIQTVVQELGKVFGSDRCQAKIYDWAAQTAKICYEYPMTSKLDHPSESMTDAPWLYDAMTQGQCLQYCPGIHDQQISVLTCPIIDDPNVLGDLSLAQYHARSFSEPEVQLVQQVATHCAIALRQSRLYQATQAQVRSLERLNRLKDDFLSTISHELRTPLSSIKMSIQLLELLLKQAGYLLDGSTNELSPTSSASPWESASSSLRLSSPSSATQPADAALPKKIENCITILRDECDREINLINDLLLLQQLEAGTQPLIPLEIPLQNWMSQVVETFEAPFQTHQQQWQINIPANLPPLTSDLFMLNRILQELLANACKFTPPGEQITIGAETATRSDGHPMIRLSVCNTGTEIPHHELDHIFSKFYRIPSTDPWKNGGTGLGLALVQGLAQYLGGQAWATTHPNQTCFWVELPESVNAMATVQTVN